MFDASPRHGFWIIILLVIFPTSAAFAGCGQIAPSPSGVAPRSRAVTAADLIALRDVGVANALAADSPFGLSPDGKQVAFVVTQADAADNSYCLALMVLAIRKGAQPRVLDQGGEPIRAVLNVRGLLVRQGYLRINRPLWSPDGHWIAYLRRERGVTQLWRLSADGRVREAVTHGEADIDRFGWTPNGQALIVTHAPENEVKARERKREALTGYAYDDRFVPSASSIPLIPASDTDVCERVDPNGASVRPATPAECGLIAPALRADTAARAILQANDGKRRAWTEQTDPARLQSPVVLWASDGVSKAVRCPDAACVSTVEVGIEGLWWSRTHRDLLFLRREGWSASKTGLYVWRPGQAPPRRLLSTDDLLMGCQMSRAGLLCARDGSLRPRRLVLINPLTGSSTELFDPNPEFKFLTLGKVRRLRWRNGVGFECFGDLIPPPGYKSGQRLPLIVVQYISRGFLRGGTGDEYPIQLFAARGYAVLSVQEPPSFDRSLPSGAWRDFQEAEIENMKGWRDRRSIFSSLAAGISTAERLGVVDPDRIGLTGLSDGATTVQFALINSRLFAAAAISSCCVDAQPMMIYGGPRLARDRRAKGYAEATREGEAFWLPVSLALNADKIDTPLLMQLPDEEFLGSIDSVTALENAGKPVSVYIFPDESHTKWQPAHRLAIYNRNLDWFDFWLKGKINPDPARHGDYLAWEKLRAAWHRHNAAGSRAEPVGSEAPDHPRAQASTSAKAIMRR